MYYRYMSRHSHREKILTEGLRVVHARGFTNASVRDIVQAAGVPQGSFTNHFASKEAFALEVIDLYRAGGLETVRETLRNDTLPPLLRLSQYFDARKEQLSHDGVRNGCLFGNFASEASDHSEAIRQRVLEAFAEVRQSIAYCLRAAIQANEISPGVDCDKVAAFIVSSLQGASLIAKTERDSSAVERFKEILFSTVLPRQAQSGEEHRVDADAHA
jgi:TetR/AcrR family transcriptional repressor of nem operon